MNQLPAVEIVNRSLETALGITGLEPLLSAFSLLVGLCVVLLAREIWTTAAPTDASARTHEARKVELDAAHDAA